VLLSDSYSGRSSADRVTFVEMYRWLSRARDKTFSILAGRSFASFGPRSVIQPPVRLAGEGRISVGSNVFIGAGSWLQVLDHAGSEAAIVIGDGTSIAGGCVLSACQGISLGQKVLMARNVYIADHMHAFDDVERAILDQGVDRIASVRIGDGAWLGQNVVVGPGVSIGRGAVIGANSVVLSGVPDFTVAVGAPARHVRNLAAQAASATS
jgi:acetyltransferase-like isoleucine patch superfamily enzyme